MTDPTTKPAGDDPLVRARREKLERWRDTYGITGYGERVDDLASLAAARALFDESAHEAHQAYVASVAAAADAGEGSDAAIPDDRPRTLVSGRCVQHRSMGKLVFLVLRDATGDLQISVSKANLDTQGFKLAQKLDYGDIVVAGGAMGRTQKGEVCLWADRFEVHCKSLVPPPEKYHGLTDTELRYRHRYIDMYANPSTMRTFAQRSRIVASTRRFMDAREFLEVETPMMQPVAGGAAARPFVTHHNALDMPLFLRIAPELYLKRLLVGGMPRVYEINRNFRNEGVDRQHNPEFTMMEVYEAFGDCWSMLELTESLLRELARELAREEAAGSESAVLPFGDLEIDYGRPFDRVTYGDMFERGAGFPMTDEAAVRKRATEAGLEDAAKADHWLLVKELFDRLGEPAIPPERPTFLYDYPSAISPLTRPHPDQPELSYRWELFVAGMELANAYTELNDPEVQLQKMSAQMAGVDEGESVFRTMDEDFLNALRVGMPPAGGLGIGIDRVVMLLTNRVSIRDVILFPLMRSADQESE